MLKYCQYVYQFIVSFPFPSSEGKFLAAAMIETEPFCRCMLHLISLSLKQAEVKPEGLRPINIVMHADPYK
jgi:hypothetical protein